MGDTGNAVFLAVIHSSNSETYMTDEGIYAHRLSCYADDPALDK